LPAEVTFTFGDDGRAPMLPASNRLGGGSLRIAPVVMLSEGSSGARGWIEWGIERDKHGRRVWRIVLVGGTVLGRSSVTS